MGERFKQTLQPRSSTDGKLARENVLSIHCPGCRQIQSTWSNLALTGRAAAPKTELAGVCKAVEETEPSLPAGWNVKA